MGTLDDENKHVREARLIVSEPREVFQELREYGEQVSVRWSFADDEKLENSLLERADQLIDLGLAQYAADKAIVGTLYKKSLAAPTGASHQRYLMGLRIACLSNQSVGANALRDFPECVIGNDELHRLLTESDEDDAAVYRPDATYSPRAYSARRR